MIYYLHEHARTAATFYALEHLAPTAREAIQILCEASRLLTAEWRILALQKRMIDPTTTDISQETFLKIERHIPFAPDPALENHPLLKYTVEDPDAWEWMHDLASALLSDCKNWGHYDENARFLQASLGWIQIHAPRPFHVGRISARDMLFPLPERFPKEYDTPDLHAVDVSDQTKRELTVRVYRLMYYAKYKNSVRFTKSRKPWWWKSFEVSLASSPRET